MRSCSWRSTGECIWCTRGRFDVGWKLPTLTRTVWRLRGALRLEICQWLAIEGYSPMQYPAKLSGVEQRLPDGAVVGGGVVVWGTPSLQHIRGFLPTFLFPQLLWLVIKMSIVCWDGFVRYSWMRVAQYGSSTQEPVWPMWFLQLSPRKRETLKTFSSSERLSTWIEIETWTFQWKRTRCRLKKQTHKNFQCWQWVSSAFVGDREVNQLQNFHSKSPRSIKAAAIYFN